MNCIRFPNVMNNTTITNLLHSDNSNIANIKRQHRQIITIITNAVLKYEPMIKISVVASYTFFPVLTFIRSIPSPKSTPSLYNNYKNHSSK